MGANAADWPRNWPSFEGLYRIAFALVRDEDEAHGLVSEAAARALLSRPQFGANAGAWFHSVMQNLLRDRWRRAESGLQTEVVDPRTIELELIPAASLKVATDRRRAITGMTELVDRLSPELRVVIDALYFGEMSVEATARELGCSVRTVHRKAKAGIEQLRAWLERDPRHMGALGVMLGAVDWDKTELGRDDDSRAVVPTLAPLFGSEAVKAAALWCTAIAVVVAFVVAIGLFGDGTSPGSASLESSTRGGLPEVADGAPALVPPTVDAQPDERRAMPAPGVGATEEAAASIEEPPPQPDALAGERWRHAITLRVDGELAADWTAQRPAIDPARFAATGPGDYPLGLIDDELSESGTYAFLLPPLAATWQYRLRSPGAIGEGGALLLEEASQPSTERTVQLRTTQLELLLTGQNAQADTSQWLLVVDVPGGGWFLSSGQRIEQDGGPTVLRFTGIAEGRATLRRFSSQANPDSWDPLGGPWTLRSGVDEARSL